MLLISTKNGMKEEQMNISQNIKQMLQNISMLIPIQQLDYIKLEMLNQEQQ
jgi:hypothetical protein